MKDKIQILELFKTTVYKKILSLNVNDIRKHCLSINKKEKGIHHSNVGGWHSNFLSGIHKPLNNLFISIEDHANIYAEQLGFKHPLCIDNIWITINKYKDSNILHSHPNALLSGVYYVKTPKNCGTIVFKNPAADLIEKDWAFNNGDFLNFNVFNAPEFYLESKENILYIFPSWLKHYVKPNMNKREERIAISFNLMNKHEKAK